MGTRLLIAFLLTTTALWAQPDKTAWDLLNKGVLDKSVEKRRLAISAVVSVGLDAEAVRLLELALHDQDASIRQMAAAGLGEIKAKQSMPALKTALHLPRPRRFGSWAIKAGARCSKMSLPVRAGISQRINGQRRPSC